MIIIGKSNKAEKDRMVKAGRLELYLDWVPRESFTEGLLSKALKEKETLVSPAKPGREGGEQRGRQSQGRGGGEWEEVGGGVGKADQWEDPECCAR